MEPPAKSDCIPIGWNVRAGIGAYERPLASILFSSFMDYVSSFMDYVVV
jgi:hypothetical protein